MADESLREIQLNSKQLVFLFMSATVVGVVIFLCGVMVGRGIGVRASAAAPAAIVADSAVDPTEAPAAATSVAAKGERRVDAEDLTYSQLLANNKGTPNDDLKVASDPTTAAPPAPVDEPDPTVAPSQRAKGRDNRATSDSSVAPAPAAAAADKVDGFVVQVAATKERTEAEMIAQRLKRKGYPAFVTTPSSGPVRYRVRVGKYRERAEAQTIAAKLQKEEQFAPWVTK